MSNNFPKVALFLSTLFFIFSCVVFSFLYGKINDNNSIAEQNNIVWQNETDRRNVLSSLDHFIKVIEPETIQLTNHYAQSSDAVPFLDSIEKVALEAGVKAEVISVNVPAQDRILVVVVDSSGSFAEIYKFLTLLENFPYQLEFASVNIKRRTEPDVPLSKSAGATWDGSFKINLISFLK